MEDMDCQDVVEIVTDYLEGSLVGFERARLEAHLKDCDGCDVYLEQIQRVRMLLGKVDLQKLEPDARRRFTATFRAWRDQKAS